MNFETDFSLLASPYYDLSSNLKSIAHPFFHAIKLVRNGFQLVYGAFVLVGALATLDFSTAGNVASGMLKLVAAATLEILNTVLAVVSLATRLLASIFNLGYVSTHIQQHKSLVPIRSLHEEFSLSDSASDDNAHNVAFTLV